MQSRLTSQDTMKVVKNLLRQKEKIEQEFLEKSALK